MFFRVPSSYNYSVKTKEGLNGFTTVTSSTTRIAGSSVSAERLAISVKRLVSGCQCRPVTVGILNTSLRARSQGQEVSDSLFGLSHRVARRFVGLGSL